MAESLIIAAIVAAAGCYAWKKLAKTMGGRKACCDQGEDSCAFKDFIVKEGGNVERLNCAAADREKRMEGNSAVVQSAKSKESTA